MSTETDAWAELEALKSRRDSRRRKLEERKKERQEILSSTGVVGAAIALSTAVSPVVSRSTPKVESTLTTGDANKDGDTQIDPVPSEKESSRLEPDVEATVLRCLCEVAMTLPVDSRQVLSNVNKILTAPIQNEQIVNFLRKFEVQQLISIQEKPSGSDGGVSIEIVSAEYTKLLDMVSSLPNSRKRKASGDLCNDDSENRGEVEEKKSDDVLSLLSMASTRERENKRIGEEILELLSRPSAKEKTLAEQFRSQGGTSVREFCPHGTKSDCRRVSSNNKPCSRLHFRRIIHSHTDESLGDCSFLNTCFHMESCKYVHYEVDSEKGSGSGTPASATPTSSPTNLKSNKLLSVLQSGSSPAEKSLVEAPKGTTVLHAAQWLHCDLRFFDMTVLGKFAVIMADPPWDIHMELPYGTLSDDEMRQLNIPALQDEGLIFLWVTGRAMELGRECLQLWGYERVDELIWVKTNQLQRIIRTGRTGHWLNHGKEHCLVGMKGNPQINRGLDADVIVAEVRATSHKPDEIYGIIERLSPGTRKIELFGRPHNIQPNWVTLGNQLEAAHLVDEDLIKRFYARYPDGNCMVKPK